MNKILATCVIVSVVVFACSFAQSQRQDDGKAGSDIVALQQERIRLLAERVSRFEAYVEKGLSDRTQLVQAQIDLITVQLEYAGSVDSKRTLFTELLAKYDDQIRVAETWSRAPQRPPVPGEPPQKAILAQLDAASRLLFLKSERIRVQIDRDMLR